MANKMKSKGYGKTDTGILRTENEDTFIVDDELGLYAVSDGVGGCAAGEVASATAIKTVTSVISEMRDLFDSDIYNHDSSPIIAGLAAMAVRQANEEINEKIDEDASLEGMGCTLTILLVTGSRAVMAHVGDSRLYRIRDNTITLLSSDHTFSWLLARRGLITWEDAHVHPMSHVLVRALGGSEEVHVDTATFDIEEGDRFILCSDGFSDYLDNENWLVENSNGADIRTLTEQSIQFANDAGGKDNITVVVVDIAARKDDEDNIVGKIGPSRSRSEQLTADEVQFPQTPLRVVNGS
jgi:protein phosphatase